MLNQSDLGQRSRNDLDLWYSYRFMYSFSSLRLPTLTWWTVNSFWKIHCFTFFPTYKHKGPCCKIGQGQPRVIIWTNLVVLDHPMLHFKFKGHRPFGSREEDFLKFLSYMGMAAILVMWPGPFEQMFVPHPMDAPYIIWLSWAQWLLRTRCLKSVDDGRRRRRTAEIYLCCKLTNEPSAMAGENLLELIFF